MDVAVLRLQSWFMGWDDGGASFGTFMANLIHLCPVSLCDIFSLQLALSKADGLNVCMTSTRPLVFAWTRSEQRAMEDKAQSCYFTGWAVRKNR
jgi:hypothetical protein